MAPGDKKTKGTPWAPPDLPLRPAPSDKPAAPHPHPGPSRLGRWGGNPEQERAPCLTCDSWPAVSCPGGRRTGPAARALHGRGLCQRPHTGEAPGRGLRGASWLRPWLRSVNREAKPLPGATSTAQAQTWAPGAKWVCLDGRPHSAEEMPSQRPCPLPALAAAPLEGMCREFHSARGLGVPQPSHLCSQRKQGNAVDRTARADKGVRVIPGASCTPFN